MNRGEIRAAAANGGVWRGILGLIAALALALPLAPWAAAESRVALVIGNSAYRHAPTLANPKNDAEGIAAALRRLKFDVLAGTDLDKAAMDRLLRAFAGKLDTADVALVFYAGHGLQVHGRNYLVPVDGKLDKESDLGFEAVSLDFIQQLMEQARRTNIMILDACRDNPLARNLARTMGTRSTGIGRGLAQTQSGLGTLIVYATQPGNVALDGPDGGNSPFTAALLKHIEAPGLEIRQVLTRVRQGVIAATREKQVPWDSSSLTGDFFFTAAPAARETPAPTPGTTTPRVTTPPAATETPPRGPSADGEIVFWQSIKESRNAADFKDYLARWPSGTFAELAKRRIAEIEKAADVTPLVPGKTEPPAKPVQPSAPRRTSSWLVGQAIDMSTTRFVEAAVPAPSAQVCMARCIANNRCGAWHFEATMPYKEDKGFCSLFAGDKLRSYAKEGWIGGVIRTIPAAAPAQPAAKPQPGSMPAPGDAQGLVREIMRKAQAKEPENGICAHVSWETQQVWFPALAASRVGPQGGTVPYKESGGACGVFVVQRERRSPEGYIIRRVGNFECRYASCSLRWSEHCQSGGPKGWGNIGSGCDR